MKPSRALRASVPSIRAKSTRRVVRSTRVPTAEPLRAPLIRSPSQWPGTVRVTIFGRTLGHWRHVGDVAASIGPPRPRSAGLARLTERRQQCAPQDSAWQHRQAHIDGLGREVFPHVVRIRTLETSGNLFGRVALSQMLPHIRPQPGIQECAGSPGLRGERRPGPVPYRRDRGGPACGCGPTRGSRCWGRVPTFWPSSGANGHGQPQAQRLTVFRTHVSRGSFWHGNTVAHSGQ